MNYYQKLERPVVNESDAIQLRFGLTLQQIMNVVGAICILWSACQCKLQLQTLIFNWLYWKYLWLKLNLGQRVNKVSPSLTLPAATFCSLNRLTALYLSSQPIDYICFIINSLILIILTTSCQRLYIRMWRPLVFGVARVLHVNKIWITN